MLIPAGIPEPIMAISLVSTQRVMVRTVERQDLQRSEVRRQELVFFEILLPWQQRNKLRSVGDELAKGSSSFH